jgi:predicted MPP superfamily phosphohydrolase
LAGIFDGYNAPDGLFGVLGNHDHWYNADAVLEDVAKNTPLKIIEHTHVLLRRGESMIALGGVGDLWTDRVDLSSTFAGVSDSIPRILLSHNPDVAEIAANAGVRVDLQLSGHTHGGEIRLPVFGPPAVPSRYGRKYERGLVQGPGWPVYVNRGLCSPRFIRFGCLPEVTCIELVSA